MEALPHLYLYLYLLLLQPVSDWLAARHVVLVMCPRRATCVLLPGYAGMCPSDYPALLFFRPTPHMHLDPS